VIAKMKFNCWYKNDKFEFKRTCHYFSECCSL